MILTIYITLIQETYSVVLPAPPRLRKTGFEWLIKPSWKWEIVPDVRPTTENAAVPSSQTSPWNFAHARPPQSGASDAVQRRALGHRDHVGRMKCSERLDWHEARYPLSLLLRQHTAHVQRSRPVSRSAESRTWSRRPNGADRRRRRQGPQRRDLGPYCS